MSGDPLNPMMPSAPVVEHTEQQHALRHDLIEAVNNIAYKYIEVGRDLLVVMSAQLYQSWGYRTFDEYVEAELGFGRRKAYYLMNIYSRLSELGVLNDPSLVTRSAAVGWVKVREIVRYEEIKTLDEYESWLDTAQTSSVAELRELLYAAFVSGDDSEVTMGGADEDDSDSASTDDGPFKRLTFSLAPQQYSNVMLALERAKDIAHSDKEGHLLDMICLQFLSHTDANNVSELLADWVNRGLIEIAEDDDE